jgi:hypothetical protein
LREVAVMKGISDLPTHGRHNRDGAKARWRERRLGDPAPRAPLLCQMPPGSPSRPLAIAPS